MPNFVKSFLDPCASSIENENLIEEKFHLNDTEIKIRLDQAGKLYSEGKYETISPITDEIFELIEANNQLFKEEPSPNQKLKIVEMKSTNDFYSSLAKIITIAAKINCALNNYQDSSKDKTAAKSLKNALFTTSSLYLGALEAILIDIDAQYKNKEFAKVVKICSSLFSYTQPTLENAYNLMYKNNDTNSDIFKDLELVLMHGIDNRSKIALQDLRKRSIIHQAESQITTLSSYQPHLNNTRDQVYLIGCANKSNKNFFLIRQSNKQPENLALSAYEVKTKTFRKFMIEIGEEITASLSISPPLSITLLTGKTKRNFKSLIEIEKLFRENGYEPVPRFSNQPESASQKRVTTTPFAETNAASEIAPPANVILPNP